jgi:hypothetical protein
MVENDILAHALVRPDKTARKAEGVRDPARSGHGDEGGYDLTNPNLHHGAEAKYAPTVPNLGPTGSVLAPAEEGFSGPVQAGSFNLAVGDSGPTATVIADQSAYEGQAFSLNIASHFAAPAAGDTLTFSASLPTGLSIDAHTGVISGTPADSDLGDYPITVTAIDAHGKAVSENFNLAVADHNDTFFIATHTGNITITGSANWTDAVDLHNIGQSASFSLTEFASDGHIVQSWTGLVVDGAAQSDHNLTLAQGDHALITVNHVDGSAADHIALQQIDHIKY